ncbi:MAG: hypothetical protein Tsb0020_26290 [Haliangiales bacterium]
MNGNEHDDDGMQLWNRAMSGAAPLSKRSRYLNPADVPAPARAPKLRHRSGVQKFEFEHDGAARAPGVNRRKLSELRTRARKRFEELDLHGDGVERAAERVDKGVASAVAAGTAHLCIIHGRGNHSPDGPVLPEVVRETLLASPTRQHVLAFCPARGANGGVDDGAIYVWLKRAGKR